MGKVWQAGSSSILTYLNVRGPRFEMPAGAIQRKNQKKAGLKKTFIERFEKCCGKYHKCLIVTCENVTATVLQKIRRELGTNAEFVFGKNSLMRLVIKKLSDRTVNPNAALPELAVLEANIAHGAALIFTDGPLQAVRDVLSRNCVGSAARVGAISPVEIVIPPMKTTMGPTQVNVLHALNIQSKIFKGTIEITSEKVLVRVGDKVGASEANLLNILGMMPFRYEVKIRRIYDGGKIYGPEVLDITQGALLQKFNSALTTMTALSVGLGYPTKCSSHLLVQRAFRDIAAVALAGGIDLPQLAEVQALLADPAALARARAAAASTVAAPVADSGEKAAVPSPEEKHEEEAPEALDMSLDDLFG